MEFSYLARVHSTEEALRNFKKEYIGYLLNYTPPHQSIEERKLEDLQDFTDLVPMKRTEFDSHLVQSGAYGWTILNHNIMARDRYLHPSKAYETDVHELIHTEDEHETRQLTSWMLAIQRAPNYYRSLY